MTDVEANSQAPIDGLDQFQPALTRQEEDRRLIRSYIAVLTSALGGVDYSSDEPNPPYRLGDEAFACLKDIKKWLKSYDDERNTWEVAVACAESGLVINDLLVILCDWEAGVLNKNAPAYRKNMNDKIALACLELLVPLTWPLELGEGMYKGQLQHYSNLKKHQVNYKKHILSYHGGRVLKAVVRLALPIISTPRIERSGRDNGILRLCTFFFRNVLTIEPAAITKATSKLLKPSDIADNMPAGVSPEDINLAACLVAFENNLVFHYLLTICGSITKDFDSEFLSMACLEMVYNLTRGIRASVVIEERNRQVAPASVTPPSATTISTNQATTSLGLSDLLSKEKEMRSKFKSSSATRHGRFGTLLSLQTTDQGRLTLSGQQNLSEHQNAIAAFDAHKNWHKSQPFRYDSDENVVFAEVHLSDKPKKILNKFINDFLDGAFNPLVNAISKEFTSDSDSKPDSSKIHFLLVIAWFLEAERYRNGVKVGDIDYGLIVAGLNERTFILVFKYLKEGTEKKTWAVVHSAIIAFKEIATTTNFMGLHGNEEDQEIATNIKERLFHKEHYLELLSHIPRSAYKHSPSYVNNCVDLVHTVLKTLEDFSNEDMTLFIQSKRKQRVHRNISKEQQDIDEMEGSDIEAIEKTGKKLSKERKFNFDKYQTEFVHPGTIDTYIAYLNRFEDLGEKDIKKGLQFLHRAFVVQKNHTILYRMDFMLLLHKILSNDGLPRKSHIRKHFTEFLSYFMKKLRKSLDTTPTLYIEMLFGKFHSKPIKHYLNTGEIYVDPKSMKKVTKYVTIRGYEDMDLEMKVSIIVAALIDDDLKHLVEWLGNEMERILVARVQHAEEDVPFDSAQFENQAEAVVREPQKDHKIQSNDASHMNTLVSNPKVRYLLEMANFSLPAQTGEDCIFKGESDQTRLSETLTYINMYLMQPVEFDNGKSANDFIKIKKIRSAYDEDSDDDFMAGRNRFGSDDEDNIAFEVKGNKVNEGYNDDVLDNLEDAIETIDGALPKGVARAKNKPKREAENATRRRKPRADESDSETEENRQRGRTRKKRRNRGPALPYHHSDDDEGHGTVIKRAQLSHQDYISAKYVNDSADESEDEEFFAKEQRLREILIKNNGILGAEQLQEFVRKTMNGEANGAKVAKGNTYLSDDDDEKAVEDLEIDKKVDDESEDTGMESFLDGSKVLDQDSQTGSPPDVPLETEKRLDHYSDLDEQTTNFEFVPTDDPAETGTVSDEELPARLVQETEIKKVISDEDEPTALTFKRKARVVFSDDDDNDDDDDNHTNI